MGLKLIDQYTYLHFSVGVISYYWNIKLETFIFFHILYEIIENSNIGMNLINKISQWPGGKEYPDSILNIIGDILGGVLGWYSAKLIDHYGSKYGLFKRHII